jgi:Transposase IS4
MARWTPYLDLAHAESVVLKLMDGILDRGHILYTDNFYTSVPLAQQLLSRKTYLCGTLRKNRKHLPEAVVSAKLKENDVVARRSGEIVVSKWKDKRDVLMLSTIHAARIVEGGKRNRRGELIKKPDCILDYKKPDCILDYNVHMCGVDRLDQLLSYYSPLDCKTLKWYRKVVLQTLDMAMSNAYLLYRKMWRESSPALVSLFICQLSQEHSRSTSRGFRCAERTLSS